VAGKNMIQPLKSEFSSWVEIDFEQVRSNALQIKKGLPEHCKIAAAIDDEVTVISRNG